MERWLGRKETEQCFWLSLPSMYSKKQWQTFNLIKMIRQPFDPNGSYMSDSFGIEKRISRVCERFGVFMVYMIFQWTSMLILWCGKENHHWFLTFVNNGKMTSGRSVSCIGCHFEAILHFWNTEVLYQSTFTVLVLLMIKMSSTIVTYCDRYGPIDNGIDPPPSMWVILRSYDLWSRDGRPKGSNKNKKEIHHSWYHNFYSAFWMTT